ncbi:MAG: glyoxalase, partial [Gammaproteobacteria bacterium]
LPWEEWQALAARLEAEETEFIIAPRIRFQGRTGEQATMFLRDPSGNALEFKAFRDQSQIFARARD